MPRSLSKNLTLRMMINNYVIDMAECACMLIVMIKRIHTKQYHCDMHNNFVELYPVYIFMYTMERNLHLICTLYIHVYPIISINSSS